MDSLSLFAGFLGQPVVVGTVIGPIAGVLLRADSSKHGGIGCLLLETCSGWVLVKEWVAVKRRM
jgi:galactitol-specific phosphotransferase system IIC component